MNIFFLLLFFFVSIALILLILFQENYSNGMISNSKIFSFRFFTDRIQDNLVFKLILLFSFLFFLLNIFLCKNNNI